MNFIFLVWLFALAITVHNLEEAIWLPEWSKTAGRWHRPVSAKEFRFAVFVLTVLAYAAAGLATAEGKESTGAYLAAGYALAMLLNVFLPHGIATLVMRRYVPGTLTALIFNLPVTIMLLYRGFHEGYIHIQKFVWLGPLVVFGVLASIPLLFALGRRLPGLKNHGK